MTVTKLCLLGATGSIGQTTLKAISQDLPNCQKQFQLLSFSFHRNLQLAIKIIEDYHPLMVATSDQDNYQQLKQLYPNLIILNQIDQLIKLSNQHDPQTKLVVINAIVGSAGLIPSYQTLDLGLTLLLANKESLVMAGPILKQLEKNKGGKIIPLDSEHSSILQLINGVNHHQIKKYIVTASGGSLYNYQDHLDQVTVEMALNHPTWEMGAKITIDSATLVNKGYEIVEAGYLFDLNPDQIEVLIHRQSLVHAIIEFDDHSYFLHMANCDMLLPIWYGLNYPNHYSHPKLKPLDFQSLLNLTFEPVPDRFEAMYLIKQAWIKGGFHLVVVNAANEKAVELFLNRQISFDLITKIIRQFSEKTLELSSGLEYNITNILIIDQLVKQEVEKCFGL